MKLRAKQTNRWNGSARACGQNTAFGFTLIELLVVISIIGVLASLVVGISAGASTSKKISATQVKLKELEALIENYKASFGGFPPDAKFANGQINTVTNQLFYELTGTVYQGGVFTSNQGGQGLNRQICRKFFGVDGIQNTVKESSKAKSFIELGASDFGQITTGDQVPVNLLLSPVRWPARPLAGVDSRGRNLEDYRPVKSQNPALRLLNPFQYRSSGRDRFNQASFDLWVDVPIRGKIYRISNWSQQPKVISRAD